MIPYYVIDSTKPIWQGEVKNCGMIMGTNALVAFQFCISHSNGIVISPVSLMKQEESADLLKSHESSKQTNSHPSTSVECSKSVQVEMSVPTPLLTELVTLPKLVKTQLDASQLSTELVIQPSNKSSSDETSNKTFVVVLKHTVQVMPGFTKWIDVQVQEQSTATDVALCSTDTEIPEQCTEPSIPQHPCTDSDQINLQQSNYLPMIVPDRNMIDNEQCDFADGICNCQELGNVPPRNWGTQPQVFRKGTVVGHLEPVNIVSHNDPIWKDFWGELPDCSVEGVVRMCQTENRLDQLQQQIKISDHCSEAEKHQLLNCLLERNEVFALSDEELGKMDVFEHTIDTSAARPVKEPPRRLPYALRKQLEEELDKLIKINCIY